MRSMYVRSFTEMLQYMKKERNVQPKSKFSWATAVDVWVCVSSLVDWVRTVRGA